jgi:hypothetical protein
MDIPITLVNRFHTWPFMDNKRLFPTTTCVWSLIELSVVFYGYDKYTAISNNQIEGHCIWYWELTLLVRASTSYASTLSFVVSRFDAQDMRCAVRHDSRRFGSHRTLSEISVIRATSAQRCFFVPSDCQCRSKNFTWCGGINSWSVQPRRNHLLLWNRSWIPTIRLAASAFQQVHFSKFTHRADLQH